MAIKDSFKLRSQSEMNEEYEKKQKEKTRQHWLSVEGNRKEREKYEIKEISGWMYLGPVLGFVAAVIAGIMIWLSSDGDVEVLWWVIGGGLVPIIFLGITSDIDDSWKASISAKLEIGSSTTAFDSNTWNVGDFKYNNGYIYTDSTVSYWFYNLARFVAGLSTVIFSILVAILLFMWFGSISIAPTTVIIVLLVLILLK